VLDVPDVRRLYVELDGARDRDAAVWRWIAASWDPDGFEVGVDGGPLERRSLPGPFDLDVFEIDGVAALLVVGGASSETTPRDDRSLCSPALDARDIARLVAP
jgi:hypothetical protein